MAADAGLVHAVEDEVGIVGQIGAAADAPQHQTLSLHHRQRAAHRGAAGIELLRQLALVGQLGAGHHQPVADASEQRAIDQRRRRPIVGGDCRPVAAASAVSEAIVRFSRREVAYEQSWVTTVNHSGAIRIDQRTTSTGSPVSAD